MVICWPNVLVEEANLTENICLLRRVLCESFDRPVYIETVHRRGYRFIAATTVQDADGDASRQTAPDNTVPERNSDAGKFHAPVAGHNRERDEADHLCMRARYYWSKYTAEGLKKAIDSFRQAIKTDPDYAPPHTGLADCYYRLSNINVPPKKAMPKAKRVVMTALRMDETSAEAHSLLGLIRMSYDRDWPAAENEFKRAVELAPDWGLVHKRYGWALGMLGRLDEALGEMSRALALESRSSDIRVGLGIMLHLARRYDAAVALAQQALDLEPEFFPAHVLLGIAHVQQSRLTKGVAELQKAASLADVPWTLGYLGYAHGVSGRRREALKILTVLKKRSQRSYVSPYAIALIHAGLSQKEQALQSLERTYEDRNEMMGFVNTSPELDSLRFEERFVALLNVSQISARVGNFRTARSDLVRSSSDKQPAVAPGVQINVPLLFHT
jgi:tetratricopeptide (TPR) repeat protein